VTSTTVTLISFACIFGGSLLGIVIRSVLPERYFSNEEKDALRLGLGLIATLSALVLGLLISTAKSSYDARRSQLTQIATDVILADRSLELFGPETSSARRALQSQIAAVIDQMDSVSASTLRPSSQTDLSDFYQMVRRLSPRDDSQKTLKAEALRLSLEVGQVRASALARESSSIPRPLLVILVFWLTALFVGFGLFAPRNLIAVATLGVCALTAATAVLLILDMDQPLSGFMKLSIEPLRNAMVEISGQR
jgi:hypothetical protein